ncbi:MAG: dephospho-CoA kinase [Bacteroidota bacterium]
MLKIGITGGIGSGKTTVCQFFELFGIPVYYADPRAKALMTEDAALVEQVKTIFGEAAYLPDGSLNRKHIAGIAFQDKSRLALLNAAVHPAVARDGERWNAEQSDAPYTLKEAALLFESGSYEQLDKIITIFAPRELRLQRVLQRDQSDRADVEARMDQQMPEEEKLRLADYVIHNDGQKLLLPQVVAVHRQLLALSAAT